MRNFVGQIASELAQAVGLRRPNAALCTGTILAPELANDPRAAELARLQKLWAEQLRLANYVYTPDAALARFLAHQEEHVQAGSEGKEPLSESRSREWFTQDTESRREAANMAAEKISAQAVAASRGLTEAFIPIAEAWMQKREKEEREEAEKFGAEYFASPALTAAQALVTTCKQRLKLNAFTGAPARQVAFLAL